MQSVEKNIELTNKKKFNYSRLKNVWVLFFTVLGKILNWLGNSKKILTFKSIVLRDVNYLSLRFIRVVYRSPQKTVTYNLWEIENS